MARSNVRLARLLYDFKGAVHSLLTLLWSSLFEQYFPGQLMQTIVSGQFASLKLQAGMGASQKT
jgi:hypothetical protein